MRKSVCLFFVLLCTLLHGKLALGETTTKFRVGSWLMHMLPDDEVDAEVPISLLFRATGTLPDTQVRYGLDVTTADHDFFQDDQVVAFREGYLEMPLVGGDFRLGRLLLPWGRADQVNPTDSLVTRDYQWKTTADDEQKYGNDGLQWVRDMDAWRATAVWLPHMQSSRLPWVQEFALAKNKEIEDHRNVALRLDHAGQQLDWGVSIFQGLDVMPSLAISAGRALDLEWINYRIRRFGLDAAMNLGKSTIRAELAHTHTLNSPLDTSTFFPGAPEDDTHLVVGMDRDIFSSLNLIVQLLAQYVSDNDHTGLETPAQIQKIQALVNQQPVRSLYGASWRIKQSFLQETLSLELAGIAYGESQGQLWRPRLQYLIDDHNSITIGADRYYGSSKGMLGILQPNSAWFVQWQGAY